MNIADYIMKKKADFQAANTTEALRAKKKALIAREKERTEKKQLKQDIRELKTARTREGLARAKKGVKQLQENSKKRSIFGDAKPAGPFAPSGSGPFSVDGKPGRSPFSVSEPEQKKKQEGKRITITIR